MNILDKDYPVIARVARVSATRALTHTPKYMEVVQYVVHLIPSIQQHKSHEDVEIFLSKNLSAFGVTFEILDEDGYVTSFDDELAVTIVLDSSEKVTLH